MSQFLYNKYNFFLQYLVDQLKNCHNTVIMMEKAAKENIFWNIKLTEFFGATLNLESSFDKAAEWWTVCKHLRLVGAKVESPKVGAPLQRYSTNTAHIHQQDHFTNRNPHSPIGEHTMY